MFDNELHGAVQFIIKHDPEGLFSFASLQSDAGGNLLKQYHLPSDHFDSFILIENGRVYQKSTALHGPVEKVPHAVKQNDSIGHIRHFHPPLFLI